MAMSERCPTPINRSQQRGLQLCEILTPLRCDISLQHQPCSANCNVPQPSLSKMLSRWFMQVSSSGKITDGMCECSKGQKSRRRHILYRALQTQLSPDRLWQHACWYNSLIPSVEAQHRSWPEVLCAPNEVRHSWGSGGPVDLRRPRTGYIKHRLLSVFVSPVAPETSHISAHRVKAFRKEPRLFCWHGI